MDWSLIILIAVIALFAWRGFRSGFIRSLGRVFAILAGYTAAILFSTQLSAWVEMQFGWPGVVSFIAASLALFLGAGLAVMLIFALLRRVAFPGDEITTASAVGGSLVGALVGGLLAIAIVWSFSFVRDIRMPVAIESAMTGDSSGVEAVVNSLAGNAVSAAMSAGSAPPEIAQLSGALMASPSTVTQHMQRLMTSDEWQALIQDPRNRRILDSGKPELVQQLPAFRALAANPDLLALVGMAGLSDSGDVEADLAQKLTQTWLRVQRVKNDPRVQAILNDPDFLAALNSGNPVALLTDSQMLELADIIFSDDAASPASDDSGENSPDGGEADSGLSKEPTEIYQWTDSSGRIHYSDTKPESDTQDNAVSE